MSDSLPVWFSITAEPGPVSPGVTGQDRDRLMRGIARMIPATDRM